jgi:peptide/nickel transport system ATP-binding protein
MSVLAVSDLFVDVGHGRHRMTVLDGVSLELEAGGAVGLVGESGSGKSTLARAIVGWVQPRSGSVVVEGVDYAGARGRRLRELRSRVQVVFQDPRAALNPRMSVGAALEEVLAAHGRRGRQARRTEVVRLLDEVSLDAAHARSRPGELSGGQRQRVALARALAADPSVIIADEVTSALDASVQGAVLNLLARLRRERGVSLIVISHDLAVVRWVSDDIAVMQLGRIVEHASVDDLLARPQHPYTRELIATRSPAAIREQDDAPTIGEQPDPLHPPSGCRFRTLCPVGPLADPTRTICCDQDPGVDAEQRIHGAACHFVSLRASAAAARAQSARLHQ